MRNHGIHAFLLEPSACTAFLTHVMRSQNGERLLESCSSKKLGRIWVKATINSITFVLALQGIVFLAE